MPSGLITLMENSGFIKNGRLKLSAVKEASLESLLEFCVQFSEISSVTDMNVEKSIFIHSASLPLAGHRTPCRELNCRLEKIQSLVQFSAFYSDRVYIQNFLYNHVLHADEAMNSPDVFRKQFIEDLEIYAYIEPLIKTNNIVPVTIEWICPHCLAVGGLRDSTDTALRSARSAIIDRYVTDVKYELEQISGYYYLCAKGPEDLLPHGVSNYGYGHEKDVDVIRKALPEVLERLNPTTQLRLVLS